MKRRILVALALGIALAPSVPLLATRFANPPTTAFILLRHMAGSPVITGAWIPAERLPAFVRMGAIAAEDLAFCRHRGFDPDAIAAQIAVWRAGGRPTGASTITMQLARNLFLWPARSLWRKALEAWITPQVGMIWPRRRQLEVYLNVAEFGPGVFGVQAGAHYWFGVDATALDADRSARLLAILPAPDRLSPVAPDDTVQRRAAAIRSLVAADDPRLACARLPSDP